MIPVDQNSCQATARLINEARIPLVPLTPGLPISLLPAVESSSLILARTTWTPAIEGRYLADTLPKSGNVIS